MPERSEFDLTTSKLDPNLRLWPGLWIAGLVVLLRFLVPPLMPEAALVGVIAGVLGGLATVIWWTFFSRAPGLERWTAALLMVGALALTARFLHPSVATAGMGMLFYMYAIPLVGLAFVLWAVVTREWTGRARWLTMVATIFVATFLWTTVRTGGVFGSSGSHFAWRWSQTPEERLLAQDSASANGRTRDDLQIAEAQITWPGFRGAKRDGHVTGVQIDTDWAASPPVELWRRPVGPAWSSFAVQGNWFYTQEQRGEEEIVSCYDLKTGEPVWKHSDSTRFWESNAGAGPRGTPTLSSGRVFAFGANGVLNALDAANGDLIWSRNAAEDSGTEIPMWGFSSSPLVVEDVVLIAVSGRLAAYDAGTGDPLWTGPPGSGYSSPHPTPINGVTHVLHLSSTGISAVAPVDGNVLWEHSWPGEPIVQPALTTDGDVLLSTAGMTGAAGTRRISVTQGSAGSWTAEEQWTTNRLKPYFNDFVIHEGHAYGFDGSILASIDLADGQRKWKGGRYGHGQLLLLEDQDVLLVLSEEGELALVSATSDGFTELASSPAIEGKTWNHPVLVGDVLLVRNDEEMAAFRLALH